MTSIKSDVVIIKKAENFDNTYIECELKNLGIDPIRWAIVDVLGDKLKISVSYLQ